MSAIQSMWEHAKDLRDNRRAMERYRPADIGSRAYAVLLDAERRAVKRAYEAEQLA